MLLKLLIRSIISSIPRIYICIYAYDDSDLSTEQVAKIEQFTCFII